MKNVKLLLESFVELHDILADVKSLDDIKRNISSGQAALKKLSAEMIEAKADIASAQAKAKAEHDKVKAIASQAEGIVTDAQARSSAIIADGEAKAQAVINAAGSKSAEADRILAAARKLVHAEESKIVAIQKQQSVEQAKLDKIRESIAKLASA